MCSLPQRWHEGKEWKRLLDIYDEIAKQQFESSRLIPGKYGDTQVNTSGNPQNPPLIFFHGIATNSLMFGEWLFPKLSQHYYCIALDTIGDMGRSYPKDGDPANGPKNDEEMAEWAVEVLNQVLPNKNVPFDIVGYSMGAYIGTCVARYYPKRVSNLILLAPAGVVAPVRKAWLAQAILFAIASQLIPQDSGMAERLRRWFFGSMMADVDNMKNLKYPELRQATDAAGSPKVNIQPVHLSVEALRDMVQPVPTLLVIGRQESVIDLEQAVQVAQDSNMTVKVYENAGHMMFCEEPREKVIEQIVAFLSNKNGSSDKK